jgi:hypothetical protein
MPKDKAAPVGASFGSVFSGVRLSVEADYTLREHTCPDNSGAIDMSNGGICEALDSTPDLLPVARRVCDVPVKASLGKEW